MAGITTTKTQALQMMASLEKELNKRARRMQQRHDYFRGKQPLRFASPEFRTHVEKRYEKFSDNWCASVAEASTERMKVVGIRLAGADAESDTALWNDWLDNGGDSESGLAFLSSIVADRSFGLVWGTSNDEPVLTFEDGRQAIVGYEPGSRRKRRAGFKWWSDGSQDFSTLYLADSVWKWQRTTVASSFLAEGDFWIPDSARVKELGGWEPRQPAEDDTWPLPNPLGVVSMFEMPNRPLLGGEPISDIAGVMAMQDAINLLWAQLFTTADFAAFPTRVIFGAERPQVPILDENGQDTGLRKDVDLNALRQGRMLWVSNPNGKAEEWSEADLSGPAGVIEVCVGHIASQTRTPPHYLLIKQGLANLAADALRASETGLVKKVQEKHLYAGEGIREGFALMALVRGDEAKAAAVRRGTVLWADAEMRSEAQLVDALQKMGALGFPFRWIAERYGLTPAEIDRVMQMKQQEQDSLLFGSQPPAPPAPQPPAAA